VHASPTINRPNGTFGFAYFDYKPDFQSFRVEAQAEIDRVQNSTGLVPAMSGENVIHYSSIPWINFTGLSHARAFKFPDSCPKISFGKMTEDGGRRLMPLSVHVHHALMDGYHVGQYIDLYQEMLNGPLSPEGGT
jgi:chloramphenicol O-acetyltransferase type A